MCCLGWFSGCDTISSSPVSLMKVSNTYAGCQTTHYPRKASATRHANVLAKVQQRVEGGGVSRAIRKESRGRASSMASSTRKRRAISTPSTCQSGLRATSDKCKYSSFHISILSTAKPIFITYILCLITLQSLTLLSAFEKGCTDFFWRPSVDHLLIVSIEILLPGRCCKW